jgi:pyruvate,water dikinase
MLKSFLIKLKNLMFRQHFRDYDVEYDYDLIRFFMSDGFEELKKRYGLFNDILSENNAVINIMSEIQAKVSSTLITFPYFKEEVSKLCNRILAFVRALNRMSPKRYNWLFAIAESITARIEIKMETQAVESPQAVYSLQQVSILMGGEMGSKATNLGEAKNILNLPVPRGLVFSTLAYRDLIAHNNLEQLITPLMSDLGLEDTERIQEASVGIQKAILDAEVPPDLRVAFSETLEPLKKINFFAVRSSAIGEDGEYSFAGQFRTVLNVPGDTGSILDAYKQVCASLYTERAIRYRLANRIPDDHGIAMAVLVLEMIPATASGVLYTVDPNNPESDQALVSAVWGLGKYAVDGTITPDVYVLDRKANGDLLKQVIGEKHVRLVVDPERGTVEEDVPLELQKKNCLTDDQLHTLYEFSQLLERHFGAPQDIEWSIDARGWIYILQTRSLETTQAIASSSAEVEVHEKAVVSGTPTSAGVVSGPVFLVKDLNLSTVPRGSILVTKTMDPELAKLIPLASGLIAEMGSPTTHLATVAREFHKPSLTNAEGAMEVLRDKEIITLDASKGSVYKGRIDSLLKTKYSKVVREVREEKNLPLIKNVMRDIVPLTLTHIPNNPVREVMMEPKDFNTIHDIIRYIHEVSVREVFRFGGRGEAGVAHVMIVHRVPLDFYIIDIGEGLSPEATFRRKIAFSDVSSSPFLSLLKGMTHEGVSWAGPVEFNLGGFFSVASRSFIRSDVTDKGGKAYVLVSKDYLNFHSRLAYHFSTLDTVCGDILHSNYLSFRYGGGGAGADGRARRAALLKDILESLDFRVNVKGDIVTGLFRGGTRAQIQQRLDQLGRLMGFTRQLDMSLRNKEDCERYFKAFFDGKYSIAQH